MTSSLGVLYIVQPHKLASGVFLWTLLMDEMDDPLHLCIVYSNFKRIQPWSFCGPNSREACHEKCLSTIAYYRDPVI